jgi:hypothetical protein
MVQRKIIAWPNAEERFWRGCRRIIAREAAAKLDFVPEQIEFALARLEAIGAPARMRGEKGPEAFLSRDAVWFLVAAYGEIWRLHVHGIKDEDPDRAPSGDRAGR